MAFWRKAKRKLMPQPEPPKASLPSTPDPSQVSAKPAAAEKPATPTKPAAQPTGPITLGAAPKPPPPRKPKVKKKFNFWLNALQFFMKNTLTYVVLAGVIIAILLQMPAVLQKNEFYTVLKSGQTNYLCLAHELGIFEERKAGQSLAARADFIRFNKVTFLRDYLKDGEMKVGFIAAASDAQNIVYWTKLTEKEAFELSRQFGLDFGTCLSADPTRMAFPGAYRVTNN